MLPAWARQPCLGHRGSSDAREELSREEEFLGYLRGVLDISGPTPWGGERSVFLQHKLSEEGFGDLLAEMSKFPVGYRVGLGLSLEESEG